MIVFLIGFMGSGKSTFGKKLASKMSYTFVDSDKYIEEQEKNTISEIFESKGEEYFRQLESEFLKELNTDNVVVSLGGGTPCFNENIRLCKSKGKLVYLKLEPNILMERLLKAKSGRPLVDHLKDKPAELLKFITSKLNEREVFYDEADIAIAGFKLSSKKMNELVKELVSD